MKAEVFNGGVSAFLVDQNSRAAIEGLIAIVDGAQVMLRVRMEGHDVIAQRDDIFGGGRAERAKKGARR